MNLLEILLYYPKRFPGANQATWAIEFIGRDDNERPVKLAASTMDLGSLA